MWGNLPYVINRFTSQITDNISPQQRHVTLLDTKLMVDETPTVAESTNLMIEAISSITTMETDELRIINTEQNGIYLECNFVAREKRSKLQLLNLPLL